MRDAGAGEAGSDVWLADQEDKLNTSKSVHVRDTNAGVQRVFPNGASNDGSGHGQTTQFSFRRLEATMVQRQTLRGSTLDEAMDALLAQMVSLGLELAPISRPEVQRRLGLTSRATLVGDRGRRSEAARITQLKESGRDPDSARGRKSLEERIAHLKAENTALITQRGARCHVEERSAISLCAISNLSSALEQGDIQQ